MYVRLSNTMKNSTHRNLITFSRHVKRSDLATMVAKIHSSEKQEAREQISHKTRVKVDIRPRVFEKDLGCGQVKWSMWQSPI